MDVEEKKLYIKLAYGYYQNKEYKKALDLYERIYRDDQDDFNVLNMLGDTYLKANFKDKALEAYISTLSILERKEQPEKLIRLAKKVSKTWPEESRIKSKLKNALRMVFRDAEKKVSEHDYAGAKALYESIEEFNSDDYPVNFKLMELKDEAEKYAARSRKAQEIKKEVTEDPQKDIISKFDRMARGYMESGDYDGAVETYITALKLAPGNDELRTKLHAVYTKIASASVGEKVWEKIDRSPVDRLAEIKKKALEERQAQIMKDEEERARRLIDEEQRIQDEYESQEAAIIQAAAVELKSKLDEAQKSEQLKAEEMQKIIREQEDKKKELLERIKREAIDKWKKQKDAIIAMAKGAPSPVEQKASATAEEKPFEPKNRSSADLMINLKKAYEAPKVSGNEPDEDAVKQSLQDRVREAKEEEAQQSNNPPVPEKKEALIDLPQRPEPEPIPAPEQEPDAAINPPPVVAPPPAPPKQEEAMTEDIGEAEKKPMNELVVNDETMDSLITMSYIYINQGVYKEAMHIYNKLSEKYPANREVKAILDEITKRQGS
ncbi:MAG: tetratricopeptide repeat protein [Spirochaetia bacterium]|nr:tetratricopeptide repeat protein [Spirochaetia bacterium]